MLTGNSSEFRLDQSSPIGWQGILFALNKYTDGAEVVLASATPTPITSAQLIPGVISIGGVQGGGYNIQLPTVALLVASLRSTLTASGAIQVVTTLVANRGYIPCDGTFAKRISIINDGTTQIGTVITAAGWTLTGTMTIATDTRRDFLLTISSPTAAILRNLGSSAL